MAQLTQPFSFSLPPLYVQPPPSLNLTEDEPAAKRGRFEEWERAGTSPSSHSESETSGTTSAPESRASHHEEHLHEEHQEQNEEEEEAVTDEPVEQSQSLACPIPTMMPLNISTDTPTIALDAKFHSYKQFEEVFEAWKRTYYHPFRVASSETLKVDGGGVNETFRYRYVVYHCAHYGEPRMRGIGKRPNQSYLPCGCRAMLRVNYNFQEKVLKITTLEATHFGHEQNEEVYTRATMKNRGSMSPAGARRIKREFDSSFTSPLSVRNSAASSYQNSPASTASPIPGTAFANPMFLMQQHQARLMGALMNQQKENMSHLAQQHLQMALGNLHQRPMAPANPAMLNILNCLSSMPFMQQPAHGMDAPQPALQMKQEMEASSTDDIDVVNDFKLPPNLPAPKPMFIKMEEDVPPVLEAETPVSQEARPTLASELELLMGGMNHKKELKQLLAEMSTVADEMSSVQAAAALPELRSLLLKWRQ